jgi:two-component system CheB/CheR fusion protein
MRKLIDGLLDFSRLSGPKQKHEEIDLQALIQNLLSDFEIIINETNAEIKFQYLPVIQAVQIQMEQLFHNLISNALKFSKPNESPYIEITFRSLKKKEIIGMELNPSQRYVNIIVSDRGIGFNENYKEKIFEIFLRLQSTKDYAGSGIGLALCRRIVNNHGAKIFAKSIENIGTEFHIILPAI